MDLRQEELNQAITRYKGRLEEAETAAKDFRATLKVLRRELKEHMEGKQPSLIN